MADTFYPLSELVVINDQNLADIEVSNLFNMSPALEILPAVPASNGTVHKYLRETGAPTPGFRAINDGIENTISDDTLVTVTLQIMDASFAVDVEIAKSYKGGKEAFIQRELMRHLRQAFFTAEKQIWYGNQSPGSTAGFEGIADILPYLNSPGIVVNAAGSTPLTGSSVYAVRVADDSGFAVVAGNDAKIEVEDTVIQRIAGSATGTFPAYYTAASGYMGVQIGSTYDIGRIANLTEDSGKGLTDDLISTLLSKFKAGMGPTHLFMSRRSLKQLQQSRTATNATGAPAPFPEESFGVKIVVTDSILDTEAIATNEPT